jgi:ATP-dependent RNA helicase RhlE
MSSFSDFSLLASLTSSLAEQSLTRPTEVQARTIPALLNGRPVVAVAETGSGKTLSYVLPMLHQLKTLEVEGSVVSTAGRPRGLVVVPGRELGDQVSRVFKSLTHATRLRVRTVLGGSHKQVAIRNISGKFEVLVATPGRLIQLLDSGELHLDDVRMLVFDEADQMIDHGFLPVARRLVSQCQTGTLVAMFSATLPRPLEAVVQELYDEAPLLVRTRGSQHTVPTLEVDNRNVVDGCRTDVLRAVFKEDSSTSSLLFANTRKQCDRIADWLESEGIPYVVYRGEMDRIERRTSLRRFRRGEVAVLIATDLGSRGLDIERVQRVINVHLPQDIDNYLHRVGRTARAGRAGLVINLVTERDQPLLDELRILRRTGA